jgi:hypothetical protein
VSRSAETSAGGVTATGRSSPSHAVSTAHSGVIVSQPNTSRDHVPIDDGSAYSSIATPHAATAPHHVNIARTAVRGARWKNRVIARPKPCSAPHTMNAHEAPCHRPPRIIVSDRFT